MELEPRYLLRLEFLKGNEVKHCQGLIGSNYYVWNGYPVYNALVLAVMTNSNLAIVEQVDDPNNPSAFKEIETSIDGFRFWESYVNGFKIGFKEFRERPIAPYGNGSDEFINDLHHLYMHGDEHKSSWLREAKSYNLFLQNSIFFNLGHYGGLCYGVDELVKKYPSIRESIYNCQNQSVPPSENVPFETILENQSINADEILHIVPKILAPLGALNPQRQNIMNEEDFERLIRYTEHLVLYDAIPEDIKVIEQTGISTGHIRYTYYRLHERLFTTNSLRPTFYHFLHRVFRQFKTQEIETTRKKFATHPTSYFTDFNISL